MEYINDDKKQYASLTLLFVTYNKIISLSSENAYTCPWYKHGFLLSCKVYFIKKPKRYSQKYSKYINPLLYFISVSLNNSYALLS